jgi:hypothetical protein
MVQTSAIPALDISLFLDGADSSIVCILLVSGMNMCIAEHFLEWSISSVVVALFAVSGSVQTTRPHIGVALHDDLRLGTSQLQTRHRHALSHRGSPFTSWCGILPRPNGSGHFQASGFSLQQKGNRNLPLETDTQLHMVASGCSGDSFLPV